VRVSRIGAFFAPFGTKMTVCSLTPSRMGIISTRRVYSKLSVDWFTVAGLSLDNAGYCGDAVCATNIAENNSVPKNKNKLKAKIRLRDRFMKNPQWQSSGIF
jgi:hypothetical protein